MPRTAMATTRPSRPWAPPNPASSFARMDMRDTVNTPQDHNLVAPRNRHASLQSIGGAPYVDRIRRRERDGHAVAWGVAMTLSTGCHRSALSRDVDRPLT